MVYSTVLLHVQYLNKQTSFGSPQLPAVMGALATAVLRSIQHCSSFRCNLATSDGEFLL